MLPAYANFAKFATGRSPTLRRRLLPHKVGRGYPADLRGAQAGRRLRPGEIIDELLLVTKNDELIN